MVSAFCERIEKRKTKTNPNNYLLFLLLFQFEIHFKNPLKMYSKCIQGGLKAIVWTQLVQGIVIVTSILIVAICGISQIGGLNEIWNRSIDGGRIHVPE